MGKEEEFEDTISEVLDERDDILPLKETGAESLDPSEMDSSMEAKDQDEEEIEMPIIENDDQAEESPTEIETQVPREDDEEQNPVGIASFDEAEDLPGETDDPPAELSKESETNDFIGLDNDETADMTTEQSESESKKNVPNKNEDEGNSEKAPAEKIKDGDTLQDKSPLKEIAKETTKAPEAPNRVTRLSLANKIISFALVALIITGFVLYHNPSLIGLTKAQQPETPGPGEAIETVTPVPQPVATPSLPSKRDQCLSKIEEAVRLRRELLEKNDEIYELDLHYRNGIAELEEEIYQELKRAGTTSYKEAMKNKRIELNLRTIQRRRAYTNGLIKPAYWLNSGSEELFYLVRKAQLDLQLTEIAGGIDLNKHTRHINAAIQKYRPSPDKLAVDPQQSKVQTLEKIWQQIIMMAQASGNKEKNGQFALNPKDKLIIDQICSGNFERIAELTSISSRAAKCLSGMNGSDLFLNGLMTLPPAAAQQLFQWQGNWICLNGVKNLSPAAAQYLFKWKGNWISLNSLNDFPPELALYLLKWEGQQLELMGLKYNKNEANQKTLKYLALWETTGGKLFVTDKIRQKMDSLM